ncbi:hypothetical protein EV360DRAFT_72212 [Lentinula raphanica]|nr:hypothetical protein EV360DRAFT_72212 [Lentinula raphanica]
MRLLLTPILYLGLLGDKPHVIDAVVADNLCSAIELLLPWTLPILIASKEGHRQDPNNVPDKRRRSYRVTKLSYMGSSSDPSDVFYDLVPEGTTRPVDDAESQLRIKILDPSGRHQALYDHAVCFYEPDLFELNRRLSKLELFRYIVGRGSYDNGGRFLKRFVLIREGYLNPLPEGTRVPFSLEESTWVHSEIAPCKPEIDGHVFLFTEEAWKATCEDSGKKGEGGGEVGRGRWGEGGVRGGKGEGGVRVKKGEGR